MATENPITTATQDDAIRYRVLLAVPEAKNIPYFALGIEATRRRRVETEIASGKDPLSGVVSGNVLRKLQSGAFGDHYLIRVRRRVLQKTTIYSRWLAFPAQDQAEAFVADNRKLGLDVITAKRAAELNSSEKKLKETVALGRYDLGKLKPSVRQGRAAEYVSKAEQVDGLYWGRWALLKLREDLAAVPEGVSVG